MDPCHSSIEGLTCYCYQKKDSVQRPDSKSPVRTDPPVTCARRCTRDVSRLSKVSFCLPRYFHRFVRLVCLVSANSARGATQFFPGAIASPFVYLWEVPPFLDHFISGQETAGASLHVYLSVHRNRLPLTIMKHRSDRRRTSETRKGFLSARNHQYR